MGIPRHTALLYRDERFFIESVITFIQNGLDAATSVLAIVTAKHQQALSEILANKGLQNEKLIFRDTNDCLMQFMVDGWPNEQLFMQTMEGFIGPASKHGDVRVFGEMVTVLCNEGNSRAAMRLEELWDILVNQHNLRFLCANLRLLCAYPLAAMYGEEGDQIRPIVCEVHQRLNIK
jgi:hypothetical protein